jgi:hypothetical protein
MRRVCFTSFVMVLWCIRRLCTCFFTWSLLMRDRRTLSQILFPRLLLIDEQITVLRAFRNPNFREITLPQIDVLQLIQLLHYFIMHDLCILQWWLSAGLSVHDRTPPWSWEIIEAYLGIDGKFRDFRRV